MKRFLILVVLAGCTPVTVEPYGYSPQVPPYAITTMPQVTPSGIKFDSSGQVISGELIDRLVTEVEQCVGKSIDHTSFIVKIPSTWAINCDGTQQVLTQSKAAESGCLAKGQAFDPKCPCLWRARLQWGQPMVVVTTPSFYLFKDSLFRFVTRTNNPWSDPTMAKCVTPSTLPLSTGDGN